MSLGAGVDLSTLIALTGEGLDSGDSILDMPRDAPANPNPPDPLLDLEPPKLPASSRPLYENPRNWCCMLELRMSSSLFPLFPIATPLASLSSVLAESVCPSISATSRKSVKVNSGSKLATDSSDSTSGLNGGGIFFWYKASKSMSLKNACSFKSDASR